jgi:serine phosphatase RsbU (regulator of sigma subunit)
MSVSEEKEQDAQEERGRKKKGGLAQERHVSIDSNPDDPRFPAVGPVLSFPPVALKRRTKIWLIVFAGSAAASFIVEGVSGELGCLGSLTAALAVTAALVLLVSGIAAAFRAIVRRLTLRLAFSYFLIGVVPIPLLAMLLCTVAYLLAHQFMATRVRREVTAVAEVLAARGKASAVQLRGETVEASDVSWLAPGDKAPWAASLDMPRPVIEGSDIWIAMRRTPDEPHALFFVKADDSEFLGRLADRTGYLVRIEAGRSRSSRGGWSVSTEPAGKAEAGAFTRGAVPPPDTAKSASRFLDGEWVGAIYLEKAAFSASHSGNDRDVVVFVAKTSLRVIQRQLFAQGIPAFGRVVKAVLVGLSAALLLVYLVALAIAFTLVGSIARSVNRLTRASQAIARGDFSVRVQSRSRDQIGDLARAFDGMADSIERLLIQTAEKERLEGEIAIARTIQQKLLPAPEATLAGLSVLADFQPLAALGGDYYDYFSMPDGRSAVAVGDVSGHGLPTGLLVAMAKAGLSTLIESGLAGPPLFARLNDLIHRSTDSRNCMTLALFAYDPVSRLGDLTNAGQLAPYRLSAEGLQSLSLPSFPLGFSGRFDFPAQSFAFAAGDRLLFVTDGFVEAINRDGEPFGFERLEALLLAEASSDAPRLRGAILEAVAAHAGGVPPADDRTLVVLTIQ